MIKLPILNQMELNLADMVIWKRRKKEEILLRTGKGNNDTNDIINYHLDKINRFICYQRILHNASSIKVQIFT